MVLQCPVSESWNRPPTLEDRRRSRKEAADQKLTPKGTLNPPTPLKNNPQGDMFERISGFGFTPDQSQPIETMGLVYEAG